MVPSLMMLNNTAVSDLPFQPGKSLCCSYTWQHFTLFDLSVAYCWYLIFNVSPWHRIYLQSVAQLLSVEIHTCLWVDEESGCPCVHCVSSVTDNSESHVWPLLKLHILLKCPWTRHLAPVVEGNWVHLLKLLKLQSTSTIGKFCIFYFSTII